MEPKGRSPLPSTEPIFVGFAGRIGSGKTSAANYLSSKYGFQYARYSQVLQNLNPSGVADRDRLQQLGWDIMDRGRQAELSIRIVAMLDPSRNAVIDGLRHLIDFRSLSSSFGERFEMIFLETKQELRFERLQSRFASFAEFQSTDLHPVETHIDELRPFAGVTIQLDGPPEFLIAQLDTWMVMHTRLGGDG